MEDNEDVKVIYPVHLNLAVRDTVYSILGDMDRVKLLEPIDVRDMHNLMDRCFMIMTDSGRFQEEAPSLGKPVLVFRTETERPEAVEAGTVELVGVNESRNGPLTHYQFSSLINSLHFFIVLLITLYSSCS